METAQAPTEEALYSNLATTRVDKPSGYPSVINKELKKNKVVSEEGGEYFTRETKWENSKY